MIPVSLNGIGLVLIAIFELHLGSAVKGRVGDTSPVNSNHKKIKSIQENVTGAVGPKGMLVGI